MSRYRQMNLLNYLAFWQFLNRKKQWLYAGVLSAHLPVNTFQCTPRELPMNFQCTHSSAQIQCTHFTAQIPADFQCTNSRAHIPVNTFQCPSNALPMTFQHPSNTLPVNTFQCTKHVHRFRAQFLCTDFFTKNQSTILFVFIVFQPPITLYLLLLILSY